VLFDQQFQIIFLSVFPSPPLPPSSCSPLSVAIFPLPRSNSFH